MSVKPKSNTERLVEIRRDIQERSLKIIRELLPAKIIQLSEIVESKDFGLIASISFEEWKTTVFDAAVIRSNLNEFPNELEPRKRDPRTGTEIESASEVINPGYVETNKSILEPLDFIKNEILLIVEWVDLMQTWIQLNIPRIQSQESFGVEVQGEVLGILGSASSIGPVLLDSIPKYYLERAKIIKKAYRFYNFEDYARAIYELDQSQKVSMKKILVDIYFALVTMHDVLIKNLEKLCKPQSELESSLII